MVLNKLKLNNFRNYLNLELEFSPEVNLISGSNGSGKTNILEAISVISCLRSFRQNNDLSMVRWNSNFYYCKAETIESDFSVFEVGFYKETDRSKKKIKIDGNEIKKVSDYYGNMISVSFIPSDINIISGTPDLRRRYVDSVISKIYPEYIDELNRFRDILISRNILLKKIKNGSSEHKQLDVWNRLFTEKSFIITQKRRNFINEYSEIFKEAYKNISGESIPLYLKYNPSLPEYDIDSINKTVLNSLESDIRRGGTGTGPQRDDYTLLNEEKLNFINYASQGQRRTAAISFKLAEYEIIKKMKQKKSIILIDDIFSELDENRRFNMIDLLMKEGQLILTMVDKASLHIDQSFKTRFFYVNNGKVI